MNRPIPLKLHSLIELNLLIINLTIGNLFSQVILYESSIDSYRAGRRGLKKLPLKLFSLKYRHLKDGFITYT